MTIHVNIKKLVVMASVLALGALLGVGASRFFLAPPSSPSAITAPSPYDLINPAATADIGKHFIINFSPLKKEFVAIQNKYTQKTYVYFVYLNNASWIGLGEKDVFYAASTVKVPLAMAILKAVEDGKLRLTDRYTLEELDLNKDFGDLYKAGANKEFTVEELLAIMLKESDNTAAVALTSIFAKIGVADPFRAVYGAMGWEFDNMEGVADYRDINLKTLANVFIVLYNARYLTAEHSQLILKHLSVTPFDNKIAASAPSDITVAHKVGIAAGVNTFSDCGIIYAPNRHYLLCAGSQNADEATANTFMSEISKAAYSYVIEH
ncbi:metallo-hydrolase family protein [Candidatus Azambacteria bacterium]|nr:metallo-hydrolase family protein [Candidatus Azambacteria bacterium]